MNKIEKRLAGAGYIPVNIDYPSRRHSIEYLADRILQAVLKNFRKTPETRIHFVTHSLGGIIVRYYLKHHRLSNLGRVVMLGPPNQGSEIVDLLEESVILHMLHGPALKQLSTVDQFLRSLGPVGFELGVIAGIRPLNPLEARLIPGPSDGKVSVERAKVEGMTDFLVVPHSHTFIMRRKAVIDQVIHFLRHGAFKHAPSKRETDG